MVLPRLGPAHIRLRPTELSLRTPSLVGKSERSRKAHRNQMFDLFSLKSEISAADSRVNYLLAALSEILLLSFSPVVFTSFDDHLLY
jgi:hypothetical protein